MGNIVTMRSVNDNTICPQNGNGLVSIEIDRFTEGDIDFGKELTDSEGWNRSLGDWRRLLRLEPKGYFKATVDGLDAGIIGSINYDRVAWINSLIVRKDLRGRRVGEALMFHCLESARRSGATSFKLDSVPGVEPFYERFGFRREFLSLRFMGNVKYIEPPAIEVFRPRLDDIERLDLREMGIDRSRILKALFEEPDGYLFACGTRDEVTGYLMGRQAQGRIDLGPCVVEGGDMYLAENLIRAAMSSIGAATFKLCVPGNNMGAARLVRSLGIEQREGPTRMSFGDGLEEPNSIITMMSPEKG